jgi:hypothetical protein
MSILSIDHHSSKSTIKLSFHFQEVTKAVTYVPCPVMSPELNPMEHIWYMLGSCVQAREPPDRRCRSDNSGRLMTLLDLSPADFRRFLTVLVDRRLLRSQCCLSMGLIANDW